MMLTLPKLLCFGMILIARRIEMIIGRNNAATPCSGMIKDNEAQESIIPRVSIRGLFSNRRKRVNAIRLCSPCVSMAAAMIKAPMRKKTA